MPQGITRASITGFDQVIKNLNIEILAITTKARKGLTLSAKFLRNDMDTYPPLIPEDLGNLRDSWEVHNVHDPQVADRKFGIRMGFSANYALWVHEMYGAVNWSRPGSGPGFFIQSINRNHDTILQIIASATKIP